MWAGKSQLRLDLRTWWDFSCQRDDCPDPNVFFWIKPGADQDFVAIFVEVAINFIAINNYRRPYFNSEIDHADLLESFDHVPGVGSTRGQLVPFTVNRTVYVG